MKAALLCTAALLLLFASTANATSNDTGGKCGSEDGCTKDKDGIVLPVWRPLNPSKGFVVLRGVVYGVALIYMFFGVAIVADKFMAAIEVITSQEKDVTVTNPETGEKVTVQVRIWNETVSNLTLMALGSSAPEILLSVIEIIGNNFEAGDLGPGTIVGSAAFNLFMIMAICVYVIPDDEVRRIEHLRVFIVTASFSVIAYIWLYLIISHISKGEVQPWEAGVTLLMFPLLVILAYWTDKKIFLFRFLDKQYTAERVVSRMSGPPASPFPGDSGDGVEMLEKGEMNGNARPANTGSADGKVSQQERHKRTYLAKMKELKAKHPHEEDGKLAQMAAYEILTQQQKSRAYYRVATTRRMTGSGNVLKRNLERKAHEREVAAQIEHESEDFNRVCVDPPHYTVMENVGTFDVMVMRIGDKDEFDFYTYVDFKTVDGTAVKGSDYVAQEGTLVFAPRETQHNITITILDDDEFEEDEYFKVELSNVRNSKEKDGIHDKALECKLSEKQREANVTILDDDHQGVFTFEQDAYDAPENLQEFEVRVLRTTGARGHIHVPYRTMAITGIPGDDYDDVQGELMFQNNENEKTIKIPVMDKSDYNRNQSFRIQLGLPKRVKAKGVDNNWVYEEDFPNDNKKLSKEEQIALQGRPKLGGRDCAVVTIVPSQAMREAVDQLMADTNMGQVLSTSTWREQFVEAITISAGDDDDDNEDADAEANMPSWTDYALHFVTVFWKLLFAFVPPTDIWNGWACFVVSIFGIGLMTAVIGDLASHFGCTVGLKDAVTAISLVALGTSVPDTFASKQAAVSDRTADASIGNVTGSNAVNVFLGIGVAWSIAALYHWIKGTPGGFEVEPGTLGFSVTVFCVLAVICIATMMVRRVIPSIGGELGGPRKWKIVTSIFFCSLWFVYILMSTLVAYCVFDPGF